MLSFPGRGCNKTRSEPRQGEAWPVAGRGLTDRGKAVGEMNEWKPEAGLLVPTHSWWRGRAGQASIPAATPGKGEGIHKIGIINGRLGKSWRFGQGHWWGENQNPLGFDLSEAHLGANVILALTWDCREQHIDGHNRVNALYWYWF